jgi:hypothetical protein
VGVRGAVDNVAAPEASKGIIVLASHSKWPKAPRRSTAEFARPIAVEPDKLSVNGHSPSGVMERQRDWLFVMFWLFTRRRPETAKSIHKHVRPDACSPCLSRDITSDSRLQGHRKRSATKSARSTAVVLDQYLVNLELLLLNHRAADAIGCLLCFHRSRYNV